MQRHFDLIYRSGTLNHAQARSSTLKHAQAHSSTLKHAQAHDREAPENPSFALVVVAVDLLQSRSTWHRYLQPWHQQVQGKELLVVPNPTSVNFCP